MRSLRNLLLILIAAGLLLYLGDYGILRIRAATGRNAFGKVSVEKYYAIKQKTGKTELSYIGTEDQTCVNALFPHLGFQPCWYLSRHTEQQIDI